MNDLDRLYVHVLHQGLISLRNASMNGDWEFCKAESEYLHEIPSLIGEANLHRHIYQATTVRPAFLQWARDNNRDDVLEFVNIWLASAWRQIDDLLGVSLSNEQK